MIIGEHRDQVIKNIADHAQKGLFNEKVEIDDPQTSSEESMAIVNQFWQNQFMKILHEIQKNLFMLI